MRWKHLFEPHILERGLEYRQDHRVRSMVETENQIRAIVDGYDAYQVKIRLDHGEIGNMYCSCPYAEKGSNCKHMAAVLYSLESKEVGEKQEKEKEAGYEEIYQIVKTAKPEAVRKFLTDLLVKDRQLLGRFKISAGIPLSETDLSAYKRRIDHLIDKYVDEYNYLDYDNAMDFLEEAEGFFEDVIDSLIKSGAYQEAFQLSAYFLDVVDDLEDEDMDQGLTELEERCEGCWMEILENCDAGTKKKMFNQITYDWKNGEEGYLKNVLENTLFGLDNFHEKEFLARKLELIDQVLEEEEPYKDEWYRENCDGIWEERRLSVMEEMGNDWPTLKQYCYDHWKMAIVRQYYINKCMEKQDYEAAIHALVESKDLDRQRPGMVDQYRKQLKNVYRITGRQEEYKKELWEIVMQDYQRDMKLFRELKSLYSEEEWKTVREPIFEKAIKSGTEAVYYEEEKLYDRLLQLALNEPGLSLVMRYEDKLKKDYASRLLEKYEVEVRRMAERASSRNLYAEVVAILRRMKRYPAGAELVKQIVNEWRQTYKRRRAMMEELEKL